MAVRALAICYILIEAGSEAIEAKRGYVRPSLVLILSLIHERGQNALSL